MSRRRHVAAGDTATLPHLDDQLSVAEFWIEAFSGPGAPRCVRVDRPLTIGRDSSCTFAIDDIAASREHAEVRLRSEGLLVRDLGSRNGTYVDGKPIENAEIVDDATLRIGETLFRLSRRRDAWTAPVGAPLVGGTSLAMVRRKISLVGPTSLPVLVLGETGTGKDVVARLVHEASERSGAFIAVNCAALPETLVEAELFGHARGSFTGAAHARKGLFSAADGGTLFLDEVGDLPLAAQAKLLRVLEDGEVRAVGSEKAHKVDVRVISATNRDLGARVSRGEFRADLLARLAGVEVRMPPLRERPQDIPAIAAHLLDRADHADTAIECDALEALVLYDWPMNVRELETALRNAALSNGSLITFADLPEHIRARLSRARGTREDSVPPPESISRPDIENALRAHRGNVRKASRAAGVSRGHFYRLLKRWELDPDAYREGAAE